MLMRKKIIAGNWKMFKTLSETREYFSDLLENKASCSFGGKTVIICPPFLSLGYACDRSSSISEQLSIGAQNAHWEGEGAFTGEVSTYMIRDAGAEYIILGHSERRQLFGENDIDVARKVKRTIDAGLSPILCIGESLEEREAEKHFDVIRSQLNIAVQECSTEQLNKLIIAYEPIWAIGTGKSATPEQAQEMHAFIRGILEHKLGLELATLIPILYGGSVKPANASELFKQKDIDGALVGGASLEANSFIQIINAMPS